MGRTYFKSSCISWIVPNNFMCFLIRSNIKNSGWFYRKNLKKGVKSGWIFKLGSRRLKKYLSSLIMVSRDELIEEKFIRIKFKFNQIFFDGFKKIPHRICIQWAYRCENIVRNEYQIKSWENAIEYWPFT